MLGRGLIMKKKVYICAPLGVDIEGNVQKAVRYARFALKIGVAPVVPHFYALCLNDDIPKERELGRQAGMSLLWFCDEMWVFGDRITEGMQAEILFCKNMKIKTRKIKENEIKKLIGEDENEKAILEIGY